MTERFVVLPRSINVGTRNRVPMAELRSKLAGVVATARNWNTIEKIVAKL